MKKQIIFQVSGGIGKVVASTAVCAAINKQYPNHELIVVSGYPDVFLGNEKVSRAYAFGMTPYFYSQHIEDKDPIIFAHDPYMESAFLNQQDHLIKIWCEMFNIKYNGEKPELFLTDREIQFNKNRFQSPKPLMLIQTNGGAENQANKYSWVRDIPAQTVVKVIDHFKNDYNIVHVRRPDQPEYQDTITVSDSFRSVAVLISLSKKRLFIDSFAQHTAAALEIPSTVLWIGNKPEVFGYKIHNNIVANPFTKSPELRNSYLQKFDISGSDALQFPYRNESEIFDLEKIIESLEDKEKEKVGE